MNLTDKLTLVIVTILALAYPTNSFSQTELRTENNQRALPAESRQASAGNDLTTDTLPPPTSPKSSAATPKDEGAVTSKDSSSSSNPAPQPSPDEWHFQLTPYFWIAGVSGRAGIGTLVVDVDSGLTDSNVHLNFGFMSTFEARRNKLVILTDLQYSNLGTERPNPGILFSSATADFKTFILDPEVGYRVAENSEEGHSLDVLGGIRYWHLRTDLNLAAGILPAASATRSRDWVDAVGGLRGRVHLSPKLFLGGKADIGGGGSEFTYQLVGGVGYQINSRFALVGGYRVLHVDYDKDNFLFDVSLHGLLLGVSIRIK